MFPSIVGRPILRAEERLGSAEIKDLMVGDEGPSNPIPSADVRTTSALLSTG